MHSNCPLASIPRRSPPPAPGLSLPFLLLLLPLLLTPFPYPASSTLSSPQFTVFAQSRSDNHRSFLRLLPWSPSSPLLPPSRLPCLSDYPAKREAERREPFKQRSRRKIPSLFLRRVISLSRYHTYTVFFFHSFSFFLDMFNTNTFRQHCGIVLDFYRTRVFFFVFFKNLHINIISPITSSNNQIRND